jgi:hypothetical protein
VCSPLQRATALQMARALYGGAALQMQPCDLYPYLRGRTLWLIGCVRLGGEGSLIRLHPARGVGDGSWLPARGAPLGPRPPARAPVRRDSHTKQLFKALQCFMVDFWDGRECKAHSDDMFVKMVRPRWGRMDIWWLGQGKGPFLCEGAGAYGGVCRGVGCSCDRPGEAGSRVRLAQGSGVAQGVPSAGQLRRNGVRCSPRFGPAAAPWQLASPRPSDRAAPPLPCRVPPLFPSSTTCRCAPGSPSACT